ncbi:sulfurtransferase [Bacillus sp. FJAT-47783]|uniref:sulfurtransferase n=1 Tax=Bacillus sp. FJAT-47783 TaxID=2922712 RepID=UPI001FAE3100|nr:sulfurtransferase [Bacillus sp. FJAT-47783]
MSNLMSAKELYRLIEEKQNVRMIDCRFDLANKKAGKERFEKDHLTHAQYVDLENDLSGEVKEHGGRHPLPDIDQFVQLIEKLGIDNETIVVAYDDNACAFASRFWWMMKYIGHEQVFILNGGYEAWKRAGYPTTNEVKTYERTTYVKKEQHELLATVDDVREAMQNSRTAIIDSREWSRYIGESEPIDSKAGHIPGAISHFWKENMENGTFRSKGALAQQFSSLTNKERIIVYCGSGVTACPNFVALKEAGFSNMKLYVGSWSDWITYEDHPIETKNGRTLTSK